MDQQSSRFRTITILAIVFFVILGGLYWYTATLRAATEEVHFHAAFQVYKDGVLIDFSSDQYMHIEPCSDDEHEENLSKSEEQKEKAHLHDNIGDVAHMHRKNARWGDLFKNIGYTMDDAVVGYLNGERVFGILNKRVQTYDKALFLLGEAKDIDEKLNAVPSVQYIQDVEAKGESC